MSRIGKKTLELPEGVEVSVQNQEISVKGKKGTLKSRLGDAIELQREGKVIRLIRKDEDRTVRARHGMIRKMLENMVHGVSQGYSKRLMIVGVGYKAEVKGKTLVLQLGFSHPIEYAIPEGIQVTYDKTSNSVTVAGCDRQLVGEVAACIRRFRPPEPYKGKGVMYDGEVIRRKVGKTGAK